METKQNYQPMSLEERTELIKEIERIRTVPEYQYAKELLKEIADLMKKEHPSDKPLQRMVISSFCDRLCRNYSFSSYKCNLLSNYACKLQS